MGAPTCALFLVRNARSGSYMASPSWSAPECKCGPFRHAVEIIHTSLMDMQWAKFL